MNPYVQMLTTVVLLAAGGWANTLSAAQADTSGGAAGSEAAELAKKLQNPIADLISVPIQNNWDFGIGPEDALRFTVTFLFLK